MVHVFNSRAQEAKAGNLSSRSAWSSQQVPGQQGYTEKPHLNRTKKQNMRNFVGGKKKIFKKALCCFLVFPTTTIWLYCWVISPDPPKKVIFLIKKLFIHLFTYFWGSISVFLALLDWEIWLLLSHSWNVSPYLVLKKLLNF